MMYLPARDRLWGMISDVFKDERNRALDADKSQAEATHLAGLAAMDELLEQIATHGALFDLIDEIIAANDTLCAIQEDEAAEYRRVQASGAEERHLNALRADALEATLKLQSVIGDLASLNGDSIDVILFGQ